DSADGVLPNPRKWLSVAGTAAARARHGPRLRPSRPGAGMVGRRRAAGGGGMTRHAIPEQTRMLQASAADPGQSVWVSANAGSGKTHVLSRRVIRLLLGGADPARILCLTYTRTAAANMANKIFEDLAAWATMSDAQLTGEILALDGRVPDSHCLARARRLLARALETPGGLKIQPIHAFWEAVMHQFPLEANIAGHFELNHA